MLAAAARPTAPPLHCHLGLGACARTGARGRPPKAGAPGAPPGRASHIRPPAGPAGPAPQARLAQVRGPRAGEGGLRGCGCAGPAQVKPFPPRAPRAGAGGALAPGSGVQWAVSGPTSHREPRPWGTGSCSAGGPASAAAEASGQGLGCWGRISVSRARSGPEVSRERLCLPSQSPRAAAARVAQPSSPVRPARVRRGVARALGSGGRENHRHDRKRKSGDTCGVRGRDSSVRHSGEQRHWPWPGPPTRAVWRRPPRGPAVGRVCGCWPTRVLRGGRGCALLRGHSVSRFMRSLLLLECGPLARGWGYVVLVLVALMFLWGVRQHRPTCVAR